MSFSCKLPNWHQFILVFQVQQKISVLISAIIPRYFVVVTNYHRSCMQITLSLGSNTMNWQTIKQTKPLWLPQERQIMVIRDTVEMTDVKNKYKWGLSRIFSIESLGIYCVPSSSGQIHSNVLPNQWNLKQFSLKCTIIFTSFECNFLLIQSSSLWKQVKIVITADI